MYHGWGTGGTEPAWDGDVGMPTLPLGEEGRLGTGGIWNSSLSRVSRVGYVLHRPIFAYATG
eukprot:12014904-Alexandrium_andersonii.AAC.1